MGCLSKMQTRTRKYRKKDRMKAEKSYGKVTSDEYLSLISGISNKETEEQEKTLREDYEIEMDEFGLFSVNYSASCSECGFKYKYDYIVSIPIDINT